VREERSILEISVKVHSRGDATTASSAATDEVMLVARELGLELRPTHPGIGDAELSTYYVADAGDDRTTAEDAAARLLELDGVDGAYVSPDPELP
jgi:hypothetical protein